MRAFVTLFSALLIIGLIGCSSTEEKQPMGSNMSGPEWITKAGGVYKGEDGQTAMFAVGSYRISPNFDFTMKSARASARDEMARMLMVTVQNMFTSYEREALDFYDPDTSSSVVNKEDVSRQVSNACLKGSRQIDAYKDIENQQFFVLMRLDMDSSFFEEVRDAGNAAYREAFASYTKEQKEEGLKKMDEFLEKQQNKSYPVFQVK